MDVYTRRGRPLSQCPLVCTKQDNGMTEFNLSANEKQQLVLAATPVQAAVHM